jgi:hypothetical protein
MATPAQVANDLAAHAKRFTRQRLVAEAAACERGAEVIRQQQFLIAELEAAAEAEAAKDEAHFYGEDLHHD